MNGKMLVLRCPDGRNALGWMLYTLEFERLQLLEAPNIAATPPENLDFLINEHGVTHLLVVIHTTFPQLTGCGGMDTRNEIRKGLQLNDFQLSSWLENHIEAHNPYEQARLLGESLSEQVSGAIEIAICLFDHNSQLLYLVGTRRPAQRWEWITQQSWDEAIANNHIPRLSWDEVGAYFQNLFQENMAYSDITSEGALLHKFDEGQSFHDLVLNGTAYPPEAFPQVALAMGFENEPRPDAYFSVYANPANPRDSVTQLGYALEHAIEACKAQMEGCTTNLWVLAHSSVELLALVNALENNPLYRALKSYPNWRGRIYQAVVDKPY